MEIKFVGYGGEYPFLCAGPLTLLIDGKEMTFGDSFEFVCDYPSFWECNGIVNIDIENDEYYVTDGDWVIVESRLPDFLKPYAEELAEILNQNVPRGHCGGCL